MSKRKFELEETMVASFASQTKGDHGSPPSTVEDIIRKTFYYAGMNAALAIMEGESPQEIYDKCIQYSLKRTKERSNECDHGEENSPDENDGVVVNVRSRYKFFSPGVNDDIIGNFEQ